MDLNKDAKIILLSLKVPQHHFRYHQNLQKEPVKYKVAKIDQKFDKDQQYYTVCKLFFGTGAAPNVS